MFRRACFRSLILIASGAIAFTSAACGSNTSAAGPGGGGGRGRGRGGDGGAAPVVTAKVASKDVPVDIAAIGNVEAYATITLRSQVTGVLEQLSFHEGDFVKKGQLLFTIDRRPFEAALAQAEANLVRDEALLAQAEAQLARDAANAEYMQLAAERSSSSSSAASSPRTWRSRRARRPTRPPRWSRPIAPRSRARGAARGAAGRGRRRARSRSSYTMIRSPIDGRTGNLAVKVGNLVTANQTELMTIAQVQPVFVTFSVPAMHLRHHQAHMAGGKLPVIATPQDADAQPAPAC